jgi:hypothetical protein
MKRTYRYERGAAPVVAIIVVLIITIVIFVGFQIGMLQLAYMNVREKTKAAMMYALVPPYEDVDSKVRDKAVELLNEIGAEYKEEHIKIEISDDNKRMHVEIWYSKSHSLPLYQNPKQFYITLDHTAPSI